MMNTTASAYPLTWPEHVPRSKARERGTFRTTLASALKNVEKSLSGFAKDTSRKLNSLVISSNVALGNSRPDDPGVAIWFVWDGITVCFPVDRYTTVEANLQALHHIIEAKRTELRHGTLAFVRASLAGHTALPPPTGATGVTGLRAWREVLGFGPGSNPPQSEIENAYRVKAKQLHPDHGGSNAAMAELNRARAEALRA